LLHAAREQGAGRVVMAGSCAEYDWRYARCHERTTPLRPATLYGSAKHALRGVLESFARETGLSAAWGRIFFVYGPHAHPDRLPGTVIRSLVRGDPARCSDGSQMRDFLYAADAADALVALLESEVQGPVNIASGQPVRLRTMIEMAGELLGRRELIRLGAIPARDGEPPALLADVRRLRDELGWVPRYDLRRGMSETVLWWRRRAKQRAA
jgi:nucleoside-diphosphate-sugar epimerase